MPSTIWRELRMDITHPVHCSVMTQEELSKKTGISTQLISAYENGKNEPSGYNAYLLCKYLNYSLIKYYSDMEVTNYLKDGK